MMCEMQKAKKLILERKTEVKKERAWVGKRKELEKREK